MDLGKRRKTYGHYYALTIISKNKNMRPQIYKKYVGIDLTSLGD